MQQQLQQLREELNSQQIINERIIRQSIKQSERRLKNNYHLPLLAVVLGLFLSPALTRIGISVPVAIAYAAFMIIAAIVNIVIGRRIPDMDNNLVQTAQKMHRFRRLYANLWKYELLPTAIIVVLIFWEFKENFAQIISGVFGVVIGGIIAWKIRRKVLTESDNIIDHIEALQKE